VSLRLAVHWATTTIAAACTVTVASIPFTGPAASAAAVIAATGVAFIGYATTPTRKGNRP
jgi:hypothetical protein